MAANDVKRAVVVGGGFIGMEMVENLHHKGLHVSVVEALPQVTTTPPFPTPPPLPCCCLQSLAAPGHGACVSRRVPKAAS